MNYADARECYRFHGIDPEAAIARLMKIPISLHCWQGDDVTGFDNPGALSGGIQATGNYPGKATTPEELMADLSLAFSLCPGKHKLNLHACYAIFDSGEWADRNALEPKHFRRWAEFAKQRGIGIDFNPTFFSHPMAADNLTLSSPDSEVRRFWIEHGKACLRIAEFFAQETGVPCVMNIWIPDGSKDIPADRTGPRARLSESLDEILSEPYDKTLVYPTLESKVFGIGLESYTVANAEFALSYAASRGITPLLDNGHFHPTETVSDKISSLLLFHQRLALHVTRPVRWDSDHVVLFDDETREIAKEIVSNGHEDRIFIALDYFDASINRIAAWVVGVRSLQKALLAALLTPEAEFTRLQDIGDTTALMVLREENKMLPIGAVWEEFCLRSDAAADGNWFGIVREYEKKICSERNVSHV